MKNACLIMSLRGFAAASPAYATGDLTCRTAGPNPIEIVFGFGHVPNAAAFSSVLKDRVKTIPARLTQWWFRDREVRAALMAEDDLTEEAVMIAEYNPAAGSFDCSVWRKGKRRWMRCYGN